MQILIVVKKDILNKVIIKNWIEMVSHLYCIVLDIREFNSVLGNIQERPELLIFMIIRLAMDAYSKNLALQYNEPFTIFFEN